MNALSDIRMQVMWNRLLSVVEEQAKTLVRTAFSTANIISHTYHATSVPRPK